jgi:hypothetical protein
VKVRTGDGTVHDCAVFELDRDRLIVQLHQESSRRRGRQRRSKALENGEQDLQNRACQDNLIEPYRFQRERQIVEMKMWGAWVVLEGKLGKGGGGSQQSATATAHST